MITLAVTGGIATGKSMLADFLLKILPSSEGFDCDRSVHDLLTKPEIVEKITVSFGEAVLAEDGSVDRKVLRDLIFADDSRRKELEDLLHPEVLKECRKALQQAHASRSNPKHFIIEIPLLYEVDFAVPRDVDVVIASSRDVQCRRLRKRNPALTEQTIDRILQAQMPLREKVQNADVVLWNDGAADELRAQAYLLKDLLERTYDHGS